MDPKIRQLLNQLPPKPFRSKLEPHFDLIRELRKKRLTYDEIAQFLAGNLNLAVAPSTIYAFMHARARRRDQSNPPLPDPSDPIGQSPEATEVAARIQAVRERAARARLPAPAKPRFEYVEGQPLTLLPDRKD